MNTENKKIESGKNEYLRNWRYRNRTLGELIIQYKTNEENIESVEHYSDKQYPIDYDSSREDIFEDAASSSDGKDPDPDNFEPVEEESVEGNLTNDLSRWILKYQISRNASNDLLTILRQYGYPEMPKCARTLLKTQRKVHTEIKCGKDYIYLGISNGISRVFASNPYLQLDSNTIDLVVNVDGVPLYKYSSTQIWPAISKFSNNPTFILSLFCGTEIPDDSEEFLREFLHEFDVLRETGFHNGNKIFLINLHAFVCDAPARQFIKCVKSHAGYFGCKRYTVERSYELGRVVFDDNDSPFRDDESFEQSLYLDTHQIHHSILIGKGIKCVTQLPLDYMHLAFLGVIKRLLLFWKEGLR